MPARWQAICHVSLLAKSSKLGRRAGEKARAAHRPALRFERPRLTNLMRAQRRSTGNYLSLCDSWQASFKDVRCCVQEIVVLVSASKIPKTTLPHPQSEQFNGAGFERAPQGPPSTGNASPIPNPPVAFPLWAQLGQLYSARMSACLRQAAQVDDEQRPLLKRHRLEVRRQRVPHGRAER
eukprot:2358054-Pleurochrysis_carterae.AAC.1